MIFDTSNSCCATSSSDSDSDEFVASIASVRRMIKCKVGEMKTELKSEIGSVSGTKAASPTTDLPTATSESILRLQLEQVVMVQRRSK